MNAATMPFARSNGLWRVARCRMAVKKASKKGPMRVATSHPISIWVNVRPKFEPEPDAAVSGAIKFLSAAVNVDSWMRKIALVSMLMYTSKATTKYANNTINRNTGNSFRARRGTIRNPRAVTQKANTYDER